MRTAVAARRRVEIAGARMAVDAPRFTAWRDTALAGTRRIPPAWLVGGAFAGGAVLGRVVGFKRMLALIALVRSAPVQHLLAALQTREHKEEQARGG